MGQHVLEWIKPDSVVERVDDLPIQVAIPILQSRAHL